MLALTESARASSIREQVSASLQHGRSALGAQTPDLASARASLAEARGALVIVQLKALARFVEELEDLLTDIDEARAASPAEAIQAMCDCIDALDGFVEALARGDAYQPLSLFPLYAQLCQLRGRPGSEIDLYYPDLIGDISFDHLAVVSATALVATPTERRSRFQAGLLRFLKGDASGIVQMQGALAGVGSLTTTPAQRSFWSAAQALLDALANAGLEATQNLKRLCGRVDLELRQLCEASRRVSEPVMREMLYHLAQAKPVSELVRSAQAVFKLNGSLDYETEVQPGAAGPDTTQLRMDVRAAQAAWERYAGGDAHALDEVCERTVQLAQQSTGFDSKLSELTHALYFLCELARNRQGPLDFALAQDIVHGLLLAELLLANAGPACHEDAALIVRRTARRRDGQLVVEAAPLEPSLVGATEHLQTAAGELGKLLKIIEQGVEAAFNDSAKCAELGKLDEHFTQLAGVLTLLAPHMAIESQRCHERVRALAQAADAPATEMWSEVAEQLAALAAQVETIGRARAHEPTSPKAASERSGENIEVPAVLEVAEAAATADVYPSAVELAMAAQPEAAQSSAPEMVRLPPPEATQRAADYAPIAFSELLEIPLPQTVTAPEAAMPTMEEPTIAAVGPMADAAPVVPEVIAAPMVEDTDDELREIFLEEAAEVLAAIDASLRTLRADLSQREPLVEIRRAFHTLKGSSRMAALPAFGDTAWSIETLLNGWLERQQPTSEALVDCVAQAAELFSR